MNGEWLLGEVCKMTASQLFERLLELRQAYLPRRLAQLGLSIDQIGEYGELMTEDAVLALADWFADSLVFGKSVRLYRSFTPYAEDIMVDA